MIKAPAPKGARHQTRNQYSFTASCAERLDAIRTALLEALDAGLCRAEGVPPRPAPAKLPAAKPLKPAAKRSRSAPAAQQ